MYYIGFECFERVPDGPLKALIVDKGALASSINKDNLYFNPYCAKPSDLLFHEYTTIWILDRWIHVRYC